MEDSSPVWFKFSKSLPGNMFYCPSLACRIFWLEIGCDYVEKDVISLESRNWILWKRVKGHPVECSLQTDIVLFKTIMLLPVPGRANYISYWFHIGTGSMEKSIHQKVNNLSWYHLKRPLIKFTWPSWKLSLMCKRNVSLVLVFVSICIFLMTFENVE